MLKEEAGVGNIVCDEGGEIYRLFDGCCIWFPKFITSLVWRMFPSFPFSLSGFGNTPRHPCLASLHTIVGEIEFPFLANNLFGFTRNST